MHVRLHVLTFVCVLLLAGPTLPQDIETSGHGPVQDMETSGLGPVQDIETSGRGPVQDIETSWHGPVQDIETSGLGPVQDIETSGHGPVQDIETSGHGPVQDIETSGHGPVQDIETSGHGPVQDIETSGHGPVQDIETSGRGPVQDIETSGLGPVQDIETSGLGPVQDIETSGLGPVFIEHDSGNETETDEACTKSGRHCISGSKCIEKKCVCPPETPKGDALIACVKKDDYLCEVSLDPFLVSYGGAKTRILLPCRHRLSYFVTPNTAGTSDTASCSFEVFGLTSITDRGVVYEKGFDVIIRLGNLDKGEFVSVDVKKLGLVEEDLTQYLVNTDRSKSPLGSDVHEIWQGVSINCQFDPSNNFAVLSVPECGTSIQFRPFNYSADNPVQSQKPGIVIQAPDTARFVRYLGGFPGSLCGHPDDDQNFLKDLVKNRRISGTSAAVAYEMLLVNVDQKQAVKDYRYQCSNASDIVIHCLSREEAMNQCVRIFSHRTTLKCLMSLGVDVMSTLINCLNTFCSSDFESCELLKADLDKCGRLHKFLADLDCSKYSKSQFDWYDL